MSAQLEGYDMCPLYNNEKQILEELVKKKEI